MNGPFFFGRKVVFGHPRPPFPLRSPETVLVNLCLSPLMIELDTCGVFPSPTVPAPSASLSVSPLLSSPPFPGRDRLALLHQLLLFFKIPKFRLPARAVSTGLLLFSPFSFSPGFAEFSGLSLSFPLLSLFLIPHSKTLLFRQRSLTRWMELPLSPSTLFFLSLSKSRAHVLKSRHTSFSLLVKAVELNSLSEP